VFDVEYRLLQLGCDRGSSDFGDDYPCDVYGDVLDPRALGRGAGDSSFAWHLHVVLTAATRRHLLESEDETLRRLCDGLVFQLVCCHRVEEALFVIAASHSDEQRRTRLAKQILERFPQHYNVDAPQPWRDAARGLQLGLDGPWPAYASALVSAGDYDGAHRALLRVAAPARAVFAAADAELLSPLLEALASDAFERPNFSKKDVAHWRKGAGLYLDYLRFRKTLKDARNGTQDLTVDLLRTLRTDAHSLRRRLEEDPLRSTKKSLGATAAAFVPKHLIEACKQNILTDLANAELLLAKALVDDPQTNQVSSPLSVIDDLSRSATTIAPPTRRDLLDDIANDLLL